MAPTMVIPLRVVSPTILSSEGRKKELEEDLLRMGCGGLLVQQWDLKNERMVQELLYEHENQWEKTLRCDPKSWMVEL